MQRDTGSQDDAVSRNVGVEHAGPGVPADTAQFRTGRGSIAHQRFSAAFRQHIFHLFRGLPKEKVGTDGGAEDAHNHRGRIGIPCQLWPYSAQRHFTPGHVDREQYGGISQQRERQPLQIFHIPVIRDQYLQQQRSQHEEQGHEMPVDPCY